MRGVSAWEEGQRHGKWGAGPAGAMAALRSDEAGVGEGDEAEVRKAGAADDAACCATSGKWREAEGVQGRGLREVQL